MQYTSSSPLIRHELDSILPYETKQYESKPFLKTKEFYKPEQFIWNNPHRTSNNLYKFYHQYNDHYLQNKAPLIKQLQLKDLQNQQLYRIQKLNSLRNQTRKRFFTRQKDRQTLEVLSGTRQMTERDYHNMTTATKRFSTITHYYSKPSTKQPMIPSHLPSKIPPKKKDSLVRNIEETYITGLKRSEQKMSRIKKMIVSETHRKQEDLRMGFQKQKEMNSKKMSRVISKGEISQLELRSVCRQEKV